MQTKVASIVAITQYIRITVLNIFYSAYHIKKIFVSVYDQVWILASSETEPTSLEEQMFHIKLHSVLNWLLNLLFLLHTLFHFNDLHCQKVIMHNRITFASGTGKRERNNKDPFSFSTKSVSIDKSCFNLGLKNKQLLGISENRQKRLFCAVMVIESD